MSQENVEIVERGIDAYNRRDIGSIYETAGCPTRAPFSIAARRSKPWG